MGDESPPLPRGSYNFNFDDFDENTNPFEAKTKINVLDNDLPADPFKPSKALSQSPTTSNNNIHDAVNNEEEPIQPAPEPVRSKNKIPRSPIQSPEVPDEQQPMQTQNSSPEQVESPVQSPDSSPQQEEESPKPQSQKKPAIRKGIKKPKFKSKLKPPPNFGGQGDEIEIFAPPPPSEASSDIVDYMANDNSATQSHDNTQDSLANESVPEVSNEQTADPVVQDDTHDMQIKNKFLPQDVSDVHPEMAQSLEMVHDFGTHEMPYEENEGISPAPEVFSDSVGLDVAGDAQISFFEIILDMLVSMIRDFINSVYLASNASVEPIPKNSGIVREEIKNENLTQDGNDSLLMTTQHSKSTARVPKHPAARVLDGDVEKHDSEKPLGEEGEDLQYYDAYEFPPSHGDSSRVHKQNGMRGDRMDHKDSIVHLVQVLKYSQSDWNKMKQDLELDFQARLLNKEREWSKKLADKEKTISHLREDNKLLQQSNDDMKCIVTEFEKTIAQLQTETEKTTNESQNSMEDIIKERDQALDDLQGVEMAFSDLHRRYEKTKSVVEGFKKNEEVLKKCIEDYQNKLKKAEEKLQTIKQQAEEKLDIASVEMDKLRRSTTGDMARLEAAMRKSDLQVASLQKSLDQKVKENEELTAICDELISKVGSE